MDILEIVLLIAGAVIFIVSFFLPEKKPAGVQTQEEIKGQVSAQVEQEMGNVRSHLDDVVNEAIEYAMEKTERSLERLSNEKIMAVSDYSDTVLQEIHKNHEEAMFLYDMLNSKHSNLKDTVTQATRTVTEMNRSVREAEEAAGTFQRLTTESVKAADSDDAIRNSLSQKTEQMTETPLQETTEDSRVLLQQTEDTESSDSTNNNARILQLYSEGKTNVAIARELGLGVGEVKLVIDLFTNQ